jgi:hypothetical protein
MIPALTNYTKNGFYYQLVERQGDWAIFRQSSKKDSTTPLDVGMAWEVFKIKVSKGGDMKVKDKDGNPLIIHCEPKECPPGDEMFGSNGWSCHTLARAREKMAERMAAEQEREEEKNRRSKTE